MIGRHRFYRAGTQLHSVAVGHLLGVDIEQWPEGAQGGRGLHELDRPLRAVDVKAILAA